MLDRRAGDAGAPVGVDVPAPDLGPRRRVEGVDVGREVAEEERLPAVLEPGHGHRAADAARRLERPVGAAGRGVERVDHAALARHEQASADHRGLRLRGGRARVAERPLEPQPRHVPGREPGLIGRLEPGVGHPGPPAVPPGSAVQPRPVRRRDGAGTVRSRRARRLSGGRSGGGGEGERPCEQRHSHERLAHRDSWARRMSGRRSGKRAGACRRSNLASSPLNSIRRPSCQRTGTRRPETDRRIRSDEGLPLRLGVSPPATALRGSRRRSRPTATGGCIPGQKARCVRPVAHPA